MDKIQELLSGYKTYIVLGAMMVLAILGDEGVLEPGTVNVWIDRLMLIGGVTLTAKLNRFAGRAA
tara:strand:+ start:198 stop:392 length:195 start_codon:yes stop_codon:yes gene_type:complete